MIPQRGQNPGYARAIVPAPSPGEGVPDRSIGGTHSRGTFGLAILHPDRLHRGARLRLLACAAVGDALARPGGGRGDGDADRDADRGSPDRRPADEEAGEDQEAQAHPDARDVVRRPIGRTSVRRSHRWPTRRRTSTPRPRSSPGRTTRGPGRRRTRSSRWRSRPRTRSRRSRHGRRARSSWACSPTRPTASATARATLIDGMASLDVNVMHAAGAEMDTGNGQLDQARAALQELSLTYGPAGC